METMTRREALNARKQKYFTGTPCKRGHLTYRYVTTGACGGCSAVYAKNYRKKFINKSIKATFEFEHEDDIKKVKIFISELNFARELAAIADGSYYKGVAS